MTNIKIGSKDWDNHAVRRINKKFVKFEAIDNDTATRKQEIDEGHRRYVEHIANVRRRLGLGVCDSDVRSGE